MPRYPKGYRLPPEKWQHGSSSTYANQGCRCELCRAAHRQRGRAYRERKQGKGRK